MNTTGNQQARRGAALRMALVTAVWLGATGSSMAASLTTETFTVTPSGWQDRDITQRMVVTEPANSGNPGGALQGVFPTLPFPDPAADDAFIATGILATATFTGNYHQADAWVIGFDFMASNTLPAELRLLVYGQPESDVITRNLTTAITGTNRWHSLRLSLLGADLGGWTGATQKFAQILGNVSKVEIRLFRNQENAQTYLVDNIFLDRVPAAEPGANEPGTVGWNNLRTGNPYRLQATDDLRLASWTTLASFTATSSFYEVYTADTNAWRFYRLVMD